jgi:hypothetical protein
MASEWLWDSSVIEAFKVLDDDTEWLKCNDCGVKPRIWVYDNGSHASCVCKSKYDASPANSESIMSVLKRTMNIADYSRDNLRLAWNKYVETGEEQHMDYKNTGLW